MEGDDSPRHHAGRMLRLAEAVEYNEQTYLNSLSSQERPHWDYCILTAKNDSQAELFTTELAERQERGFFPPWTRLRVYADPGGHRIGTAGATLYALRELATELYDRRSTNTATDTAITHPSELFAGQCVLIIHAGGDSRRIPHCSAVGKTFAMLPTTLHDGSVATLFDILFIGLAGVPAGLESGILISSGDVALTFDPRELQFGLPGVTGVAMRVEPEEASRHGVYSASGDSGEVVTYLQKPDLDQMRRTGCVNSDGKVLVDTGLMKISRVALDAFLELAGISIKQANGRPELVMSDCPLDAAAPPALSVDLYADIALAMPADAERDRYIQDRDNGYQPGDAREQIWTALRERRNVRFCVQCADPALFTHIGNTDQYLRTITGKSQFSQLYGFSRLLDSHARQLGDACVLGQAALHETIIQAHGSVADGSLVQNCRFEAPFRIGHNSIVKGVETERDQFIVPDGIVVHSVPIRSDPDRVTGHEVTLVYGVEDNPKHTIDDGTATLLGTSLRDWLRRRGIPMDTVWPDAGGQARSLWNARLYPAGERGQSWNLVEWMYRPDECDEAPQAWAQAPRLSIAQVVNLAAIEAIRQSRQEALTLVECLRFENAAENDIDARVLLGRLQPGSVYHTVVSHLVSLAEASEDWLYRARLYKVAADVVSGATQAGLQVRVHRANDQDPASAARHLTEKAFRCVKAAIRTQLPSAPTGFTTAAPHNQWVEARCPVRVDFAGGWSDTPPHSLERPGTVLNVGVEVWGRAPLRAWGRRIDEPVLTVRSADADARLQIDSMQQLADYADPSQPLALHKAAFIASGVVPEALDGSLRGRLSQLGAGFELITDSQVPRGSGVGASSILAAAVLACLSRLQGRAPDHQRLFGDVLYLEQLLGAGGGWQDQVGGVVGGAKFIRSDPRAPLDLQVQRLPLRDSVVQALEQRCVLVYTGQRRLAKNILRTVMGRYMSRDSRVLHSIREMQRIAVHMRDGLMTGDLDTVGWLMWLHWELQKILDPHCTTAWIDQMLHTVEPYVVGAKAVGAGGGGFVLLIAKDDCADLLRQCIRRLTTGTKARVYDFEFARQGLRIAQCPEGAVPKVQQQ